MKRKSLKNPCCFDCFDMKILTAMLVVLFITKLLKNAVFQVPNNADFLSTIIEKSTCDVEHVLKRAPLQIKFS